MADCDKKSIENAESQNGINVPFYPNFSTGFVFAPPATDHALPTFFFTSPGGKLKALISMRIVCLAASLVLLSGQVPVANAQTTTGTSATGQALYDDTASRNCKGCHGTTIITNYPQVRDAANSGPQVSWSANGQSMGGTALSTQQATDIAAYIATFTPNPNPANVAVPFNTAVQIAIPNITLNSVYGDYTGLETVTLPTRGTVSFSGTTATYTPTSGQTGNDSFTYRAMRGPNCNPGCSNTRTVTLSIAVAVPSNNNFASRIQLNGGIVATTAVTDSATREAGEPLITGNSGGHSVWWSWTATSNTSVTIDTNGSNFDTLLGVYTGSAVNALTLVAQNDDHCPPRSSCPPTLLLTQSSVTFTAVAGTTYQIAVDGFNGFAGTAHLNINQPLQTLTIVNVGNGGGVVSSSPAGINCGATCTVNMLTNTLVSLSAIPSPGSVLIGIGGQSTSPYAFSLTTGQTVYVNFYALTNDDFATRSVVNPMFPGGSGFNVGATLEAGEPAHVFGGTHSVWWTWTAPSTGTWKLSLAASNFDTLLDVYTGTSLNALTQIAHNDDYNGTAQSSVTFSAVAGTAYSFAVDGYNGQTGYINFILTTLGNNNFVDRLALSGGAISVTDSNVGANKEPGEPTHGPAPGNNIGGHSLWWSWIAPTTGPVTITTLGSNFDTLLGVYTGSAVNALTAIAKNDNSTGSTSSVTFTATAGVRYQIAVDGYNNGSNGGVTGNITLNLLQQQPQTISFTNPGPQNFSANTIPLSATATSGLPVTFFSSSLPVCTVSGNIVTMVSIGICSLGATQAGNASYLAAPQVLQSFTISKGSQSIAFTSSAPASPVVSGATYMPTVIGGGSGNAVILTIDATATGVCSIAGGLVSFTAVGTCVINANQAGSTNYNPATQVQQSMLVGKGNQSITFNAQAAQSYGAGSFAVNPLASASSGLPVSYGSITPGVCTMIGSNVTIVTAGSCTIAANQGGSTNYNAALQVTQNVTINPIAPSAPVIGTATPGDGQAAIGFTAPSNTGGSPITSYTATCSGKVGTGPVSPITVMGLTNGAPYTCSVTATGPGGTSGPSGTVGVTPTTAATAPNITSANNTSFTVNAAGTFTITATGTPAPTLSLTGALPAGVTFTPGTGVLAGTPALGTVGNYPLTATATGTAPPANQPFTLTITKSNQTISFTGPTAQNFSGAPLPVAATASSTLAVVFSSTTPLVCSVVGTNVTMLTLGTCTIAADQAGDANYNAAPRVTQNFSIGQGSQTISFPAQIPATISFSPGGLFGISPTAAASSGLAVTYSSTTGAICTVNGTTVTMVTTGTCAIAANQSGNANYSPAPQATRNVDVTATIPGAPTIGVATSGNTTASIAFTAPANNGGSTITSYTATCNPGAVTGANAVSPVTVSGLINNTVYSCSVVANNIIGASTPSASVAVTPASTLGASLWTNVCHTCHTTVPSGTQLNGAGITSTVLNYVRANQSTMLVNSAVQALTPADLVEIAVYIGNQLPAVTPSIPFNTPTLIDVATQITLNTVSFTSAEAMVLPAHGTLSAFSGTTVTYTPTPGFSGTDSFTYRGRHTSPTVVGDERLITLQVLPPGAPVITSAAAANTTVGQPFNYTITATNTPTSYSAVSLPANMVVNTLSGAISGAAVAMGTYGAVISASNAGGTANAPFTINVGPGAQAITFNTQGGQTFSPGGTFAVNPLATATSGLTPTYSSTTPGICTVNVTTVTMLTAGTCIIAANQSGDANYNAAPQVTQSVAIAATLPGAPTIGIATAGNTQASIAFAPPTNNGGSPITGYTATCNPLAVVGSNSVSPVTVSGLINDTPYTCFVRAINAVGTGAVSGNAAVTPVSTPTPPTITSANNTTFTVNAAGTFTVTATGTPPPTLSQTGTLPNGVTFTPGTGVLAGTPALGTVGTYPLTITASGTAPPASQPFTLTVAKANQTISFVGPAAQNFSAVLLPISATASSTLAVTFTSMTPLVCSVNGNNVTMIRVGTCTIAADQPGDNNYNAAPQVTQNFIIGQGSQTISFPIQIPATRTFAPGAVFAINPLATASSGLPVTYSAATPGVCSVNGANVTMVTAGTCMIAADQTGDTNVTPATQVKSNVGITAVVPDAPTIGIATPGNGTATINFTAPANNGGSAIDIYNATCTPGGAGANSVSPITVTGLTNNTSYLCSVTAHNSAGNSAPSAPVSVTPVPPPGQPLFQSVCTVCHQDPPVGPRFNAAGVTNTVLSYVVANQPLMANNNNVKALAPSDLAAIAEYLLEQMPQVAVSTSVNTPKLVNVSPNITLNTVSFDAVEVVSGPTSGIVSAFTGTTLTYTPNTNFLGTDTFTYRGTRASAGLAGEARTATITVVPGFTLTVLLSGNGTGNVSGTNINCPVICDAPFATGTMVTLTAVADPGSYFAGWGGDCSGMSCVVTTNAARFVTANFGALSTPDAPIIGIATGGDGQVTVNFTPPLNDGGYPITGYTVTCNPGGFGNQGAASPITVSGLTNGVTYSCFVTADNILGTGTASASVDVTTQSTLALFTVRSRKVHGSAGTFNLLVDKSVTISGPVTVESRVIDTGHTLVFTFNNPITAKGSVNTSTGAATSVASGNDVIVTLTGVSDNQRVTVTLTNVNGSVTPFPVSIGFLVGDVNGTRAVNPGDVSSTKALSGQTTDINNFRFDVNATGTINASDISAVKARSGLVLPP